MVGPEKFKKELFQKKLNQYIISIFLVFSLFGCGKNHKGSTKNSPENSNPGVSLTIRGIPGENLRLDQIPEINDSNIAKLLRPIVNASTNPQKSDGIITTNSCSGFGELTLTGSCINGGGSLSFDVIFHPSQTYTLIHHNGSLDNTIFRHLSNNLSRSPLKSPQKGFSVTKPGSCGNRGKRRPACSFAPGDERDLISSVDCVRGRFNTSLLYLYIPNDTKEAIVKVRQGEVTDSMTIRWSGKKQGW